MFALAPRSVPLIVVAADTLTVPKEESLLQLESDEVGNARNWMLS